MKGKTTDRGEYVLLVHDGTGNAQLVPSEHVESMLSGGWRIVDVESPDTGQVGTLTAQADERYTNPALLGERAELDARAAHLQRQVDRMTARIRAIDSMMVGRE